MDVDSLKRLNLAQPNEPTISNWFVVQGYRQPSTCWLFNGIVSILSWLNMDALNWRNNNRNAPKPFTFMIMRLRRRFKSEPQRETITLRSQVNHSFSISFCYVHQAPQSRRRPWMVIKWIAKTRSPYSLVKCCYLVFGFVIPHEAKLWLSGSIQKSVSGVWFCYSIALRNYLIQEFLFTGGPPPMLTGVVI